MFVTLALYLAVFIQDIIANLLYKVKSSPQNNQQLTQCINRARQINNTIQSFNNPSTFAKYSKMQRQRNKLQQKIQKIKSQTPVQVSRKILMSKKQFNIMYFALILVISSFVTIGKINQEYAIFPLSLFVNSNNQINGVMVVLVSKLQRLL